MVKPINGESTAIWLKPCWSPNAYLRYQVDVFTGKTKHLVSSLRVRDRYSSVYWCHSDPISGWTGRTQQEHTMLTNKKTGTLTRKYTIIIVIIIIVNFVIVIFIGIVVIAMVASTVVVTVAIIIIARDMNRQRLLLHCFIYVQNWKVY